MAVKKVTLSHKAEAAYLEDISLFHICNQEESIMLNRGEARRLMQFLTEVL